MTNMLETWLIIYAGSSFCQPFKESFKRFVEMSDVFILFFFFDIPGMGSAIPAKKTTNLVPF